MNEWKPIATAPRDGTIFLAWDDAMRLATSCKWKVDSRGGYWADPSSDFPDGLGNASHWMPMPEPPKKK